MVWIGIVFFKCWKTCTLNPSMNRDRPAAAWDWPEWRQMIQPSYILGRDSTTPFRLLCFTINWCSYHCRQLVFASKRRKTGIVIEHADMIFSRIMVYSKYIFLYGFRTQLLEKILFTSVMDEFFLKSILLHEFCSFHS